MKGRLRKIISRVGIISLLITAFVGVNNVLAAGYGLTLAPMTQVIMLYPGEEFVGSFTISNPNSSTQDTFYKIEIEPFYTDENGQPVYKAEGDMGRIVDWISLSIPREGVLVPNEVKDVVFRIDVPENAPAGGQYAAISVSSSDGKKDNENGDDEVNTMLIEEKRRLAHTIYAEVAGDTVKKGEIIDASVPSFLLSGNIKGSSSIKNAGNVHGNAKYKLQVFPLFSNEEIYSNEDNPVSRLILPNRTLYEETSWDETPAVGIFNVVYTVEFEGSTAEVKKMVIKCPVWLLFIIIFAIAAIVIYFVVKAKQRKDTVKD